MRRSSMSATTSSRQILFGHIPNQTLRKFVAEFDSHITYMRAIAIVNPEALAPMMNRQKLVVDAMRQRDCQLAESRWRTYLNHSRDWLLDGMARQVRPDTGAAPGKLPE